MTLSRGYSFTVRDKILTGPPVSFQRGRRRSSGFLEYIGRKVSPFFMCVTVRTCMYVLTNISKYMYVVHVHTYYTWGTICGREH